jgi:nicotinamidase-related amidase
VDTTARGAYERAYNVTFASDAMTDVDSAAHDFALTKMFPRMGEVDTTNAVLALLPKK